MPQIIPFVGIDVAMDRLDVHIHPSGAAFAVPNSAAGVRQLIGRIERGSVIALQASGGYERIAAEGLAEAGLVVFCLHPADVRGRLPKAAARPVRRSQGPGYAPRHTPHANPHGPADLLP